MTALSYLYISLLLGLLSFDLSMNGFDPAGKVSSLLLQVIVIGLQDVDVSIGRCAQALLDKVYGVLRLLRLLVKADKNLGKLIDHS
jgi:hypothetical protein